MSQINIEERKQRWRKFYDLNQKPRHLFIVNYPDASVGPRPMPYHENAAERVEWAVRNYEYMINAARLLDDDRIPSLNPYTGTEIFAEAFGCKVHRPVNNMPFALPMIDDASEVTKLKIPDVGSSTLSILLEMAEKMRAKTDKDAIVNLPDIQSPFDIAALIWKKENFYTAMIEEPEAVIELIEKVRILLTDFLNIWFERFGTSYIAHYPGYYMEGGLTLSEDEAGAISPDMFEQFALPALTKLSDHFGGIGIHCCANAEHQWGKFKNIPNLKLLNLVQPTDVIQRAYKYFEEHTCQMHSYYGSGDPWTWPEQLPQNSRVMFELYASSKEQALVFTEKMAEVCGR